MSHPRLLTRRELNRALLERQLLATRATGLPVLGAVEHLVGLQAQATPPPYYGLWSRLADFDPHQLGQLLVDRRVVRLTLMRGTVHMTSRRDALSLRPLVQQAIERGYNGTFRRRMAGTDPGRLAQATRDVIADGERDGVAFTARQVAQQLIERGIGEDIEAITNAVRVYVPLVQLPPRGLWGAGGQAKYATLETWSGGRLEAAPVLDEVVIRYLRAYGPASVMDMQRWSGLTRCEPAFARLRPRLEIFRDEDGRELFDLPDAPRPDPDSRVPVRFLGEFDNVLLGHADRRRIVPEGAAPWMDPTTGGRHVGNLLVDGVLRATWWIEGTDPATLVVRPIQALNVAQKEEVEAEGRRLLEFAAAAGADGRRIRFEPRP